MKLKLLLLYSIHATYRRIQMAEIPQSLKKASLMKGEKATMAGMTMSQERPREEEEVSREALRAAPLVALWELL